MIWIKNQMQGSDINNEPKEGAKEKVQLERFVKILKQVEFIYIESEISNFYFRLNDILIVNTSINIMFMLELINRI